MVSVGADVQDGRSGTGPTPISPPSGLATGSLNGLNPKSKFLAFEYKATRQSANSAHYIDQDMLLEEVLPALGMNVVKAPGFEADDVIAHISRHSFAYEEIHILTSDKDLFQLVTEKVNPLFPALRSGHRLFQRPSHRKQIPSIY